MRKGKMIAQGAHASMKFMAQKLAAFEGDTLEMYTGFEGGDDLVKWLEGSFKKICVGVNSEEELDEVYASAIEAGLPCAMVEDNGATEFHGIKTKTCCGIGPASPDKIDKITGHLKLL
jgi:PTH2 family peptidyl-tRNA hydrolase